MEILLFVGAAALVGAYASSRNSRDRELARQAKQALSDAKKANKRGDPQAASYYLQVARELSVQRLTEAEQRALNQAQQLTVEGHPHRAAKKMDKAKQIRQTLARDFQVRGSPPSHSLPVAASPQPAAAGGTGVAYPAIPLYADYSPQMRSPSAQQSYPAAASPQYLPPAPRYEASASDSAPPADAVRYYNQPPTHHAAAASQPQTGYHMAALPYPSVAPPPYVPSISSSPSTQPWVAPTKSY